GVNLLQGNVAGGKDLSVEEVRQGARPGRVERFPGPALTQRGMKMIEQRHERVPHIRQRTWPALPRGHCIAPGRETQTCAQLFSRSGGFESYGGFRPFVGPGRRRGPRGLRRSANGPKVSSVCSPELSLRTPPAQDLP